MKQMHGSCFLGTDQSERIRSLLEQYPQFEGLYRDVYEAYRNTERVMGMFSEELKILDRNTVQYMIDEMETEIKEKDSQLEKKDYMLEKISRILVLECWESGETRRMRNRFYVKKLIWMRIPLRKW